MEIAEVKAKREQLAKDITEMIQAFEAETQIEVTSIELERVRYAGGSALAMVNVNVDSSQDSSFVPTPEHFETARGLLGLDEEWPDRIGEKGE